MVETNSSVPSNLYICGDCHRGYTRLDHLSRHVRSHTHEKPYECPVCAKPFSRADLLKRHAENHELLPGEMHGRKRRRPDGSGPSSGRVSQACESCIQAHIRCQEQKPCHRCTVRQIECRIAPGRNEPVSRKSGGLGPESIAHVVQNSEDGVDWVEAKSQSNHGIETTLGVMPKPKLATLGQFSQVPRVETGSERQRCQEQLVGDMELEIGSTAVESAGHRTIRDNEETTIIALAGYLRNLDPPFVSGESVDIGIPDPGLRSGIATPRGVMNFGLQSNVELNDMGLLFLDDCNLNAPFDLVNLNTEQPSDAIETRTTEEGAAFRAQIVKSSVWRSRPQRGHNCTVSEQHLLSLHGDSSLATTEPRVRFKPRPVSEKLQHRSRDKLLALVLQTCETSNATRIVEAFPSVELLDSLLQIYLSSALSQAQTWLHLPTMSPIADAAPEKLMAMIAAGAILTADGPLQKTGLLFQEALLRRIPELWEADNSKTRDLELLQAYTLMLEIGLWSGNSRKMEMAESFLQPLVTILRRSGKFRYSTYVTTAGTGLAAPVTDTTAGPNNTDSLQVRWMNWAEQELWKRLVFYVFQHDVQASIGLLSSPIISYSEMALPLPCHRSSWEAPDAAIWKRCLTEGQRPSRQLTLLDCLNNIHHLQVPSENIDHEWARLAYIYARWGQVWEHRQLSSILRSETHQRLLVQAQLRELLKTLDEFAFGLEESPTEAGGRVLMMLEMLRLHLHMPLEDVQLFAGIEGREEADHVFSALEVWVETTTARQALWYAGQIVSLARRLPRGALRGILAVCVYHASITFWVYGLVRQKMNDGTEPLMPDTNGVVVQLDSSETIETQRFLSFNRGTPVISLGGDDEHTEWVTIHDTVSVLNTTVEIL